ncbi:MAG: ABC transporter permease subunit [Leptolyngbyaceae cyanobacterium SU_3_3]|nr:ABC transporter permease subunit [Leptolyngbyaceae cyanobacterium SU_3_3]NJR50629.1 ABC transporter permease subunit [Leptolyngbyaceae cyanobacterium CSU_1_3]
MIRLWRNVRFWRFAGQAIAVILMVAVLAFLGSNLDRNLRQLNIRFGFGFLRSQAGFTIGETPIAYQPSDNYTQALVIGLLNSLKVIITGIVAATIVGVTAGIARLSDNWLVRHLAIVYVEALRNMPLLLQLFFWYFAVFLSLPSPENGISLGLITFSNRGVGLLGTQLSPEFSALLAGLTIYTGTFIAEIVRGGIQSVPRGQWEAARSLGLAPPLVLRLVVLPQALRAIIPSLSNQYLNLAKNSSLAVAVGYPDLYAIASTTFNQTGRAVEVMILICATYLSISLIISLAMNFYNRSVQFVER